MGSRRDLIMSRVRQVVEDSQDPEHVTNLLCNEVMPVSPNSSYSFVENSDCTENDLRNVNFLKLLYRKETQNVETIPEGTIIIKRINRASSKSSFDTELSTRIPPVMITERRISPRKSFNKPSTSHATAYFSNNEDFDLPKDFDSDDSIKDKNYCVTKELDTTDLDTSIQENDVIKQRKIKNSKIMLQNQTKCDKYAEVERSIQDSEDQINQQTNTRENRVETVTIESGSQQAITEKEIVRETENNITNNEERRATFIIQSDDTVNETAKNTLTKRGTIRKRKVIEESTAERKEKKKKDMTEKLSLKEPCKPTCKKLCTNNISMEQRQMINSIYSALDTAGKGMFIKNNVSVANVKSRKDINKEILSLFEM